MDVLIAGSVTGSNAKASTTDSSLTDLPELHLQKQKTRLGHFILAQQFQDNGIYKWSLLPCI